VWLGELFWRKLLASVVHDAIGPHESAIETPERPLDALKDRQRIEATGLEACRLPQCSGMSPELGVAKVASRFVLVRSCASEAVVGTACACSSVRCRWLCATC
jgi:hypothetical protein